MEFSNSGNQGLSGNIYIVYIIGCQRFGWPVMDLSAPLRKHAQGVTEEGPRKFFLVHPKNFSARPIKVIVLWLYTKQGGI